MKFEGYDNEEEKIEKWMKGCFLMEVGVDWE
jgi:hypothetical protein